MSTLTASPERTVRAALVAALEAAGAQFKGNVTRCPFHPDQHASAGVYLKDGVWRFKCQACDAGGDIFDVRKLAGKPMPASHKDIISPRKATTYPDVDAAITAAGRATGGELVYAWQYPGGNFYVARFTQADGGKTFMPIHQNGDGWILKDPPGLLPLYRGDMLPVDGPIIVCEGEKCADAAVSVGLHVVTSAHGAKSAAKSDWSILAGRQVIILPDNDAAGLLYAQDVAKIVTALTSAAIAKIVHLPGLADGGDIADWISADGVMGCKTADEIKGVVLSLASQAAIWTPPTLPQHADVVTIDNPSSGALGSVSMLAGEIKASHHFARDSGNKLYVYQDGVYQPGGESEIRRLVKEVFLKHDFADKWSSHRADEVIEFIRVDAQSLWAQPPSDVLNVKNGLLNVTTRKLWPHNPNHLSSVQLPVGYDAKATCPAIEKFVSETFPQDALTLAWQIIAWLMLPNISIQKAILLLGEGANGKSTWLAAVVAFLGKRHISALSLHKLESDKFAAARLVGKLANICSDLPSTHLAGTSTFKALVGNDIMLGEHKYGTSFEFQPFARLVFSANHPPRSSDASHAFFRRWLVVPFSRTFDQSQQIPRNVLDARLSDPQELSGALNKALDALPGLLASGFIESPSMREAWNEFRETTDPISVWLDTHTTECPDAVVSKATLLMAYNADARHEQRPAITGKAFGQALKRLRPNIEEAQRTVAGSLGWCWLGLDLKPKALT